MLVGGGGVLREVSDTSGGVGGEVCGGLVGWGSEVNVNSEGDAVFLGKLYRRMKGIVGKLGQGEGKKAGDGGGKLEGEVDDGEGKLAAKVGDAKNDATKADDAEGDATEGREEKSAEAKTAEAPHADPDAKDAKEKKVRRLKEETRRLNVSDCKGKLKEYIKGLSLSVMKDDFAVTDKDKKDENFRKEFAQKIDETQEDRSKFDEKVEDLLKKGHDGNSPINYPDSTKAIKILKDFLLPELDQYCSIAAPLWSIKSQKAKTSKEIKELTWEKFNKTYSGKSKADWRTPYADSLESIQSNDADKDSEQLKFFLLDFDYPTTKDAKKDPESFAVIKKIANSVMSRVYAKKLAFKKIATAKSNLQKFLTATKYSANFKGKFDTKDKHPGLWCEHWSVFSNDTQDEDATTFKKYCNRMLADKKTPSNDSTFDTLKEFTQRIVSVYFDNSKKLAQLDQSKNTLIAFLQRLDFDTTKRRYGDHKKTWGSKVGADMKKTLGENHKSYLNIKTVVSNRLMTVDYPGNQKEFDKSKDRLSKFMKSFTKLLGKLLLLERAEDAMGQALGMMSVSQVMAMDAWKDNLTDNLKWY